MPRVQRLCLGLGFLFGAAGGVWILGTHRHAPTAIQYHVPLAIVFATFVASTVFGDTRGPRVRIWAVTLIALLVVAARLAWEWPTSGHGILGAYVMLLAPWTWLRVAAGLVLPHAAISKAWIGADVIAVPFGAVVGAALAWFASPEVLRRATRSGSPGRSRPDSG